MKLEDRPTPETDAVAVDVYETRVEKNEDGEFVYAYHTRRLEQQRDAWRELAAELAEAVQNPAKIRDALRHYAEAKKEMSE